MPDTAIPQLTPLKRGVGRIALPQMALHIPEIQKAKAKAPSAMHLSEANQKIGDALILITELGGIAVAGFTDPEDPASQCHAHLFLRHSSLVR